MNEKRFIIKTIMIVCFMALCIIVFPSTVSDAKRTETVLSGYASMPEAPNQYVTDVETVAYKEKRFGKFSFYGFIYRRIPQLVYYLGLPVKSDNEYNWIATNCSIEISKNKDSGFKLVASKEDAERELEKTNYSSNTFRLKGNSGSLDSIKYKKGETIYYRVTSSFYQNDELTEKSIIIPYKIPSELSKPIVEAYQVGKRIYFAYTAEGSNCETQFRYNKKEKWRSVTKLTGKLLPLRNVRIITTKDFYLRCRTWEKVNGKKVYSKWSNPSRISHSLSSRYYNPDMNSTTEESIEGNPTLSQRSVSMLVGNSVQIKISNTSSVGRWYVKSGSDCISLASMSNKKVVVKAEEEGEAILVWKSADKEYVCKISIKRSSKIFFTNTENKNREDVERVCGLLQEQSDRGAIVTGDLDKVGFWDNDGYLVGLNAEHCGFSGEITVDNYPKLQILDFGGLGNSYTELNVKNEISILSITNCPDLSLVSCNGCGLNDIRIDGDNNIQYISLENNNLTSINLRGIPRLMGISIYDNKIENVNLEFNPLINKVFCDEKVLIEGVGNKESVMIHHYAIPENGVFGMID